MALYIKGGRVIDPANGINKIADVKIEKGIIAGIDDYSGAITEADEVMEAAGKLVVPGLIDIHCHLREPGLEAKETIATGTRAAARGGFTALCAMPNTKPVCDSQTGVEFVINRAKAAGLVRVYPVGAITKGSEGQELAEMADMAACGAVAFSDDGKPVPRSDIMRLGLQYAQMVGKVIISHCEDPELAKDGVMHEGYWSTVLGLRGIPAASEAIMVARDILLAESVGAKLHIAHVSTARSVELIRQAQWRGVNVTGEVCPHHLALTDADVEGFNTATKVNPPLRTDQDREALRSALNDGTLTILATDHAPHTAEEKACEYNYAPFGISGLETAWPLFWRELVESGVMTLPSFVAAMTVAPAKRLGLPGGTLSTGVAADVTIIDPEYTETVTLENWQSKGKNTPFVGQTLRSWPVATIVGGRVVMRDRQVIG
ncbi:dihydroorotase [Heliomicrobium modesticaldum Ice1]|uniref:Dihydroorotase n=1 Tax=Heliobacterium modesticaldum (strain ATCC 51547 / Ice1) TaxID=498761 RepID=B0TGQ4_HELMI|nr:dihydroorotase [Heliomicrobium modesticaldum]ABZ84665.1 dihydroorotase [Heliomicrobium modesticaldum Ice1]